MVKVRKPISFDTTLRNPSRIPQFISVLSEFEGTLLNDEVALKLEGEIIRRKIFEPTKGTLGVYVKEYKGKFKFVAKDQSIEAEEKVSKYYQEWASSDQGIFSLEKMIYLLSNTITEHKQAGWNGGWESRIATQYNFINELGLAHVEKGEKIKISKNGKLMIKGYKNGFPQEDIFNESYEQSAFLNAFSKYQTNNPYRNNTIKVNFFPLVLNVIKYLSEKYNRPGISKQDLPFVIAWGNNNYEDLAEIIHDFREKFGYTTSDEVIYKYAMNLLDEETPNLPLSPARDKFINSKEKHYKFEKIILETTDEVIRKLRLTMLISLRGAGRFIDINKNEVDKANSVLTKYSENIDFFNDKEKYFDYMGEIDDCLIFQNDAPETQETRDMKEQLICEWAANSDWDFLKNEMVISVENKSSSHEVLKFIKKPVRLEFLTAVVMKKALPKLEIIANYKADDQGVPFHTASGGNNKKTGADIDVFENSIHAIIEPTISKSRSFQVEHEISSIQNHIIEIAKKDCDEETRYDEWFSLFIASNISRDVGDRVAAAKYINNVDIFPWDIEDFVDYSKEVQSLKDYKIIRPYAKPQKMPTKKVVKQIV